MAAPLTFRPEPTTRLTALAVARERSTGRIVRRWVQLTVPENLFAKAGKQGSFGSVMQDSEGSFRWITVHPWGKEEKGVPVKIRESKTEKGTWHVVAGAGGKLNYLRLTGVATPEEYKAKQKERRSARRVAELKKKAIEAERKHAMSPEEKEADTAAKRRVEEAKQKRAAAKRAREEQLVERVAAKAGWSEDEWKFDARRERLKGAGASEKRILQLEEQHHKKVLRSAKRVIKASKRHLVASRDKSLGEFPIHTEDVDKVGLSDLLDHPETRSGKGYAAVTRESSDTAIRQALARQDTVALQRECDDAEAEARDSGDGRAIARLHDLQSQLRTAELARQSMEATPEKIEQRRQEIAGERARLVQEQQEYQPQLRQLREAGKDTQARRDLEERAALDQTKLQNLKDRALDVEVLAGGAQPAVEGEKGTIAAARLAEKEAEVRAEHGDEGVATWKEARERLLGATEKYRAEMRQYKETGVLPKVSLPLTPIVDPEEVVQLIAQEKAIAKGGGDPDGQLDLQDAEALYGKGYFTETGEAAPEMVAEAEKAIENDILARQTSAFLERAESPELLLGRGGVFSEQYDNRTLHRALDRHLSAGVFNVMNNTGLAVGHAPMVSRTVCDVLGAGGAAQVLAHAIREGNTPEFVAEMAKGLGEYHVKANVEQAEERIREVEDALDKADDAMTAITDPSDLAAAQRANDKRQEKIEEARQIMGQSLGEYEATAALGTALKEGARDSIHVTLGPIDTEAAIRQLRAIGLGREDYTVTSDGKNQFATIKSSGFDKLVEKPDPERAKLYDDMVSIKRGDQDEDDYTPKGILIRPMSTFTGDALQAPSLTSGLKRWNEFGTGSDAGADMREHIAMRAANGEDVNDIMADVSGNLAAVPEEHRQACAKVLQDVFPTTAPLTENGRPVYQRHSESSKAVEAGEAKAGDVVKDAEGNPVQQEKRLIAGDHAGRVRDLVADHFKAAGLPHTTALHGQEIKADDARTFDAVHRVLSADPRLMVAHTPLGDLTAQDQRAVRDYFTSRIAKSDAASGIDEQALKQQLDDLGPEPPKTEPNLDMFAPAGEERQSQANREWHQRRDALTSEAHGPAAAPTSSSWAEYTQLMGGRAKAMEAIQGKMRSDFAEQFHGHYTRLHGEPLRLGRQEIPHAELHTGYVDPKARAAMREARRQDMAQAQARDRGKFSVGSARARYERSKRLETYQQQNQMGVPMTSGPSADDAPLTAGQRYTLGSRVEGQLASLMPSVGRSFKPNTPAVNLALPFRPFSKPIQQRAIKQLLRGKRLAGALGTGTGKTGIAIAALAHAREEPERGVKRGLFLVPSSVQGQFGGEFSRFADPSKLSWAANPGGLHEDRLKEHADADTHAVVHTHQGYRDDMLKLLGGHWGTNPEATKTRFMGLDRKSAAAALKEVWDKHGIDYQMSTVDEGHLTLDRVGKEDSLLSRVIRATSDNTEYYLHTTADPVKNDISELGSLMDKLHPDGRYADAGQWNRRYGINTTASAEALQREMAPAVYAANLPPSNEIEKPRWTETLHETQSARIDEVHGLVAKLRAARARGSTDVDAARKLAPERFARAPSADHESIAKEMQKNPGIAKEHAERKAIDDAPAESNPKIQRILKELHGNRDNLHKEPVVIFAHSLAACRNIHDAIKAAGHRVDVLTGADSTKQRDAKRQKFHPDAGDPSIDVLVLSDAGEAGLNLQRGQTLIQYDRPMTAKTHAQRKGRIDRLGQKHDKIRLVDLTTDSEFEERGQRRIDEKYDLRDITTDPGLDLDESGIGKVAREARMRTAQLQAPPVEEEKHAA